MGLSKKNKSSPPQELPDLAIDELKKDANEEKTEEKPAEEQSSQPAEQESAQEETASAETETQPPAEEETAGEEQQNQQGNSQEEANEEIVVDPKRSFFNSLSKELEESNGDISKLNEWYKNKFPQGNALEEMKEYWKEKKEEIILENISKDLKSRIDTHMRQLQKLEAEWQKIYFDLTSKEDEMKAQERKLKEAIGEFTKVAKKRGNIKKDKKKE